MIDLMAALKKSLGDEKKGKAEQAKAKKADLQEGTGQEGARTEEGLAMAARFRSISRPTTGSATSRRPRSRGAQAQGQGRQLRRPEARCLAAALGLPAGAGRRPEELGGAQGAEPHPGDNRLAMRTEDHPLDYGAFEGTIPKGEYGGGTVMLWDQGRWMPEPARTRARRSRKATSISRSRASG